MMTWAGGESLQQLVSSRPQEAAMVFVSFVVPFMGSWVSYSNWRCLVFPWDVPSWRRFFGRSEKEGDGFNRSRMLRRWTE